MKKSLVALALMGAFSSAAYAQSSVTIYGTLDAGVFKTTNTANTSLQEGKRDNNKLGFKGVEDLGNGLKALFQVEIRFEPDTGTVEGVTRPLFQGQSRVGLQGDFGMVRLGRGLTSLMETNTAYEPWSGLPNVAGFQTDLNVGGYRTATPGSGSDPLGLAGNSGNRFANALWYNSPVMNGFQANLTVATKENNSSATTGITIVGRGTAAAPQFAQGALGSVNPYSATVTFSDTANPSAPMYSVFAGAERNAVGVKLWSMGAYFKPIPDLKLMATYSHQDLGSITPATNLNDSMNAFVVGANYTVGPGKILFGYGQKRPDGVMKTRQVSFGYEYSLSARTIIYADLSQKRLPVTPPTPAVTDMSQNHYALGIRHNF